MKQNAVNVASLKLGALGYLCAILFLVFACSEESDHRTKEIISQSNLTKSDLEGDLFTVVEEQPQYPGGMDSLYKYISSEIKYPKGARISGIEGRVNIEFVVEKDGSISNVHAIESIDPACDEEAVRVVQNAHTFSPGSQRGKAVRVRMVLPIIFKLDEHKTNPDKSKQGIIIVQEVESKNGKLNVDAKYVKGEWSGSVYSPEGDVLPGANIIVVGTTSGTVSDLDGTFKVKAIESKDLHISFVGYESVTLRGK